MKPPIPVVFEVGTLRSREDVSRFVEKLREAERAQGAELERARMLGKIKNSRTDVRGGK